MGRELLPDAVALAPPFSFEIGGAVGDQSEDGCIRERTTGDDRCPEDRSHLRALDDVRAGDIPGTQLLHRSDR